MSVELAPRNGSADAAVIEQALVTGDLSKLTPAQRVSHYLEVCNSLSLNPHTAPFAYITLNGKMVLYVKRDATDQLRRRDKVSITRLERDRLEDVYVVTAHAQTADGRTDQAIGAVSLAGLRGEALANAFMKSETKAKRRVTLSICGLGFLDESEVSSIPDARLVNVDVSTGEIIEQQPAPATRPAPARVVNNISSVRVQDEPQGEQGGPLYELWQEWERLKGTAKTVGASVGAEPPAHATLEDLKKYVVAIGKRIGAAQAQAEAPF